MTRKTFLKKLANIGCIPVPEGHIRVNKGATTLFFDLSKTEDVLVLLKNHFEIAKPTPMYEVGTLHFATSGTRGLLFHQAGSEPLALTIHSPSKQ